MIKILAIGRQQARTERGTLHRHHGSRQDLTGNTIDRVADTAGHTTGHVKRRRRNRADGTKRRKNLIGPRHPLRSARLRQVT